MAVTGRGERHETVSKNARFQEGKKRRWGRKEKRYREGERVLYSVGHSCHAATLPMQPFLFVHNCSLLRFKHFIAVRPGTMIVYSIQYSQSRCMGVFKLHVSVFLQ